MTIPDPSSQPRYPGIWAHSKGGRYRIIGFCIIEASMEPAVQYGSVDNATVWIRPCSEFFDGRFKWELG